VVVVIIKYTVNDSLGENIFKKNIVIVVETTQRKNNAPSLVSNEFIC